VYENVLTVVMDYNQVIEGKLLKMHCMWVGAQVCVCVRVCVYIYI
jgi:hypothetical protein